MPPSEVKRQRVNTVFAIAASTQVGIKQSSVSAHGQSCQMLNLNLTSCRGELCQRRRAHNFPIIAIGHDHSTILRLISITIKR